MGYRIHPSNCVGGKLDAGRGQGGVHERDHSRPGMLSADAGDLNQCDAVLFCGPRTVMDPQQAGRVDARDLAWTWRGGASDDERKDGSSGGPAVEDPYPKNLVTALYEAGFAVQVNEKVSDGVSKSEAGPGSNGTGHRVLFARKDGVRIRGYQDGDEAAILEMFREVFRTEREIDHWNWKFRDNPFGSYRIAQAFAPDGGLAGHYSGYPVPFYNSALQGETFVSYQIGDIMTRSGFRQIGLARTSVLGRLTDYFHHRFCLDEVPFMYGFVTGSHKRFGERFLRYRYMYGVGYHVLNIDSCLIRAGSGMPLLLSGVSVKPVTRVTPEFDSFFDVNADAYGLLVKRCAAYLKWRYLDCPDRRYSVFTVRRFGRLVGWSVFSLRGDTLIWGDAFFKKTVSASTVRRMLSLVIRDSFPKASRLEAWFSAVPGWWSEILRNIGFMATDEPNNLVSGVTVFNPAFSLEGIRDSLYYTMGDSDLF